MQPQAAKEAALPKGRAVFLYFGCHLIGNRRNAGAEGRLCCQKHSIVMIAIYGRSKTLIRKILCSIDKVNDYVWLC